MNVYLVFEGVEVLGVYVDQARALAVLEALRAAMPSDLREGLADIRIEEYMLNPSVDTILPKLWWDDPIQSAIDIEPES